jgi:hypothetical protein
MTNCEPISTPYPFPEPGRAEMGATMKKELREDRGTAQRAPRSKKVRQGKGRESFKSRGP